MVKKKAASLDRSSARENYYRPISIAKLRRSYADGEREFFYHDFFGKNLKGLSLRGANFAMCRFQRADLRGIDLTDANLEDCDFWKADLSEATLDGANLETAYIQNANLTNTSLRWCYADDALFDEGTVLVGADLTRAHLRAADFTDARLDGADLTGANLRSSVFERARLRQARLIDADLTSATFRHSDLENADISGSLLADLSLASFVEADVKIDGGCVIDYRAVVRSLYNHNLRGFLIRTGMPTVFADYLIDCARSMNPMELFSLMQSTFISYGGPDENFAKRLYECLAVDNVRTFFFPVHAKPGAKLHRIMRSEVKKHDRVILVCSEASLSRAGVLNEIENVLAREAAEGGKEILIPVTLDEFVFNGWRPQQADIADAIRERVIADFRNVANLRNLHATAEYERLLGVLRLSKSLDENLPFDE